MKLTLRCSRRTLLLLAGVVWTIAGVNILRIGVVCWLRVATPRWMLAVGAVAVFAAFALMFSRMFRRHCRRIRSRGSDNFPWTFFPGRSWAIMAFMIALGVSVRALHLLPEPVIASFYCGLSSALILMGLRFVSAWLSETGK
jgi:hypothetical protein